MFPRLSYPGIVGRAVITGIRSVKKLLRGAEKISTGEKLRKYRKPGSYESAVKEFLSLKPSGAHNFHMEDGVSVGYC